MSATPNVALVTIDLVTAAACFFITHQLIRSPSRAFHSLPNALFVGLVACVGTLLTCCGLFAFVGASKAILLDGSDDDPTKTSVFCRIQGKPSGASPAVHARAVVWCVGRACSIFSLSWPLGRGTGAFLVAAGNSSLILSLALVVSLYTIIVRTHKVPSSGMVLKVKLGVIASVTWGCIRYAKLGKG